MVRLSGLVIRSPRGQIIPRRSDQICFGRLLMQNTSFTHIQTGQFQLLACPLHIPPQRSKKTELKVC
jgi:hypothetical protein